MTTLKQDVVLMSACAQALALRNRTISSEELTSVYYARIERYNDTLTAFAAELERDLQFTQRIPNAFAP